MLYFESVDIFWCRYFFVFGVFFFSLVGNLKGVFFIFILEEMVFSSFLVYEILIKIKIFFKVCDIDGKIFCWYGIRENVNFFGFFFYEYLRGFDF